MNFSGLRMVYLGKVRRGRVFSVQTPHKELELYVSDGGKSLRLWDPKEKRELK